MNWETIKEWLKKPVVVLAIVAAFLVAIVKLLLGQKAKLEGQLENAEANKRDAVLEQQQKDLQAQIADARFKAEQEAGRKLTDKELEDYLKKL